MILLLKPQRENITGQDIIVDDIVQHYKYPVFYSTDKNNINDLIDQYNIKVVISHNLDDANEVIQLKKCIGKVKLIGHLHCQWNYYSPERQKIITSIISSFNTIIVCAEFLKVQYEKRFPNINIEVVTNGVDPNKYFPAYTNDILRFRETHQITKDDKLVGFIGRIEEAKGLQILEYISEHIIHKNISLFLQFFNTETNKRNARKLKSLGKDKILLYNDINPDSIRPVKYFDILILPSMSEVSPLVVLEAMMSGVPIIATNSTPFFKELSQRNISNHFFSLINLPPDLEKINGNQIKLYDKDITSISQEILNAIETMDTPSPDDRIELAYSTRLAGFYSYKMFKEINEIYLKMIT